MPLGIESEGFLLRQGNCQAAVQAYTTLLPGGSKLLLTHCVTLGKPLPLAYAVCKEELLTMTCVVTLG